MSTNVAAEIDFNFAYWKQLSITEIQTGLLNNFSTIAVGSQSFYDSYGQLHDNNQLAYSHGLIGFKPRQYLDDLGLSETTQIEFYKGYIKQKGSINAVDALTKAEFNNLSSAISFYEEWAVRTGEYGALNSNPYIEITLDEGAFSVNPAVAEFVGTDDNNRGDGLTIFNKSQLYKSTDAFNGNIALLRDAHSNYDNDILTAIRLSDLNKLKSMKEDGRTLTACNRYGESIVHMACRRSDFNIVEYVLDNIEEQCLIDDYGRTPLHDACWRSEPRFDIVTLLLDKNINLLRFQDVRGSNPLNYVREEHWLQWCAYFFHQKDKYWKI